MVPTRSPEAIVDKIELFSKLEEVAISQLTNTAYEKVKTQHNSEKMVSDMISLYDKVYENS